MTASLPPRDFPHSESKLHGGRQTIGDLLWVAFLTLSTYLLAAHLDLAERYIDWTALGEIYQLDEIVFVLLAACLGLIWFSIRRLRALSYSLSNNLAMQAKLQANNDNIRQLLSENQALIKHLIEVRESERKHLATELHDVFGQHLAAMDANLTVARNLSQNKQLKACLSSVIDSTDHLRSITRQKLRQLKPPSLDSIGLSGAVQELLHDWRGANTHISVETQIELKDDEIGNDVAFALYRGLQEGLSNIRRHADADMVTVDICQFQEFGHHQLQLVLEDNGKGLPADFADRGLGLLAVRERAQSLGGIYELSTKKPSGTRLQLKLPYQPLI